MEQQVPSCAKCGKQRRGDQPATLTQWLFSDKWCSCEYAEKLGSSGEDPVRLCAVCGKRQALERSGSLTQWLFRYDNCTCETPGTTGDAGFPGTATDFGLDPSNFPLERYEPMAILGRGASGNVFRANDRVLGKRVAIKTLHKISAEQLISFQNEARAMSLLNHQNIVAVLDFGATAGGNPYLVMEFVEGETLERHIQKNGALPWRSVISMALQLCQALSHAHKKGISHRDLKSANIMVDASYEKPTAKIIDFGIAQTVLDTEQRVQQASLAGSAFYMSPDQIQGKAFDERSEIYSFGCVMFEALTGKHPFEADDYLETLRLHVSAPVPRFSEVAPGVEFADRLEAIINVCLEKDPQERYESFAELALDFHGLLEEDSTLIMKRMPAEESRQPSRNQSDFAFRLVFLFAGLAFGALLASVALHSSQNNAGTTDGARAHTGSASKTKNKIVGRSLLNELTLAEYLEDEKISTETATDPLESVFDNAVEAGAPAAEQVDLAYLAMKHFEKRGESDRLRKVYFKAQEALKTIREEANASKSGSAFVGNAPLVYLTLAEDDLEVHRDPYAAERSINAGLELAPFHAESAWVKAELLETLGEVFVETKRERQAETVLKEAINRRKDYGDEGLEENDQPYELLVRIYESQSRSQEAAEARQKLQEIEILKNSRRGHGRHHRSGRVKRQKI